MAKLDAGQVAHGAAWDHIIPLGFTAQGRQQGSRAAYLAAQSRVTPSVSLTTMGRMTEGGKVETLRQKGISKACMTLSMPRGLHMSCHAALKPAPLPMVSCPPVGV